MQAGRAISSFQHGALESQVDMDVSGNPANLDARHPCEHDGGENPLRLAGGMTGEPVLFKFCGRAQDDQTFRGEDSRFSTCLRFTGSETVAIDLIT